MEQTIVQNDGHTLILTSAQLKDRAKDALEGNYRKIISVIFLTGLMTLAIQLTFEFLASFFFSLILIGSNLATSGLSPDQMVVLLQNVSYPEEYMTAYTIIEYAVQAIASAFTSVFNVGILFICLSIACGRTIRVTDLFYGFRTQFQKSLGISVIFVIVSQLYLIPAQMIQYHAQLLQSQTNTDRVQILFALCLLLIGAAIYLPISLAISQSYMLLLDVPERSVTDLLKLSIRIMRGHKLRLFLLEVSFLPLWFLSILSFGIGNLLLIPYMNVTYAFFFLNLMRVQQDKSVY